MQTASVGWQNLANMATTGQPLLSFLAVAAAVLAAVLTPHFAARIEQRRWRSTALRLATILYEALDAATIRFGAPTEKDLDDLERTSDTLTLEALVTRCEAWPSDSIGGPDAMEAFIRLTGIGRVILDAKLEDSGGITVDRAVWSLETMPRLRDRAYLELNRLRRSLGRRIDL